MASSGKYQVSLLGGWVLQEAGSDLGSVQGSVTGALGAAALGGRGWPSCTRLNCDGGSRSPGPHTHGAPDQRCPSCGEREAGPGTAAWTVTLGRPVPQGALALGEAVSWPPQQQGSPRRSGCRDRPAPGHPQLGSGVLGVLTAPTTSPVNLLWFLQNKPFWTKTFFFSMKIGRASCRERV